MRRLLLRSISPSLAFSVAFNRTPPILSLSIKCIPKTSTHTYSRISNTHSLVKVKLHKNQRIIIYLYFLGHLTTLLLHKSSQAAVTNTAETGSAVIFSGVLDDLQLKRIDEE